ncbi:MAG: exodeoxyribonuclease VII small subunit [Phototrophicales bacterium]|nr:exodeoxyribonuclease VII small subunit [Phototrophicales bacterium]
MDDINGLSFEDAFAELEQVVGELEAGRLSLEDSVRLFERGRKLSAYCQNILEKATLRVSEINDDGDIRPLR